MIAFIQQFSHKMATALGISRGRSESAPADSSAMTAQFIERLRVHDGCEQLAWSVF